MDESEQKENKPESQRRFSQEQYDMLKRCSDKKDMTEWNEWRKAHPDQDIFLEGSNLQHAYLKGSLLNTSLNSGFSGDVHLVYAKLHGANLSDADFSSADLQNAKLIGAHLDGVDMRYARIKGVNFSRAVVDGSTLIWRCEVDRKTKFEGVGIDSARIDPATKQLLEYNIRRMNWEDWYKGHPGLKWLVRPFWLMSDYGLSTTRIIVIFFGAAFILANIYYHWGRIAPPGIIDNLFVDRNSVVISWWVVPLRALYFSVITMTLGFSDMYTNAHSIWGHILITIQALLGYVLLGALVTRFAVLFTAGGPAGKFADEKKEKARESRERHRENR